MDMFSAFVEGYVTGVADNHLERTAEIALLDNAKGQFVIRLKDVDRLLVDELREQNIIDNIRLWTGSNDVADYHKTLSWLVSGMDSVVDGLVAGTYRRV